MAIDGARIVRCTEFNAIVSGQDHETETWMSSLRWLKQVKSAEGLELRSFLGDFI